jgi:hypothetical protein
MHCIQNFLLSSRADSTSNIEKIGDFLLAPARTLLKGKQVIVFHDESVHVTDQGACSSSGGSWAKTALKIAIALVTFPFVVLGAIIKLFCLSSKNYREFCSKEISKTSNCNPKLFEMFQHVHSTADFISDTTISLDPMSKDWGKLIFKPLQLSECGCPGTQAFHRLNNPRRNNLENGIVRRLVAIQVDKSAPIKLLSMGSGELMSDFITLEKLLLAGFKSIAIDCVDPKGINPLQIQKIRDFFAQYPDISLNISAYNNIDDLPGETRDYCAVLAVDYDALTDWSLEKRLNGLTDLMKARGRLSENGFLALGFSTEDTLSGKGVDPIILTHSPSLTQILTADLIQHLNKKDEVRMAIPHFGFEGVNIFMYALAMTAEKSPEHYRTVSVSCLEHEKDQDKLQEFRAMLHSLFPHANIELSIHEEGRKYDLLFTGSLQKEVFCKTYLNLLGQESITYILYQKGHIHRQIGNQENNRIQIK